MQSRLFLQNLEARDVPSGTQLFAIAEDGGQGRVAVYRADGESALGGEILQRGTLTNALAPFPGFGGGVRIAVGDVTGDGVDDVICGAGFGGGPHVKVYDGTSLLDHRVVLTNEFFAFDASFHGGLFVAVGQVYPATVRQEIIVGAGETGGAHVRVFTAESYFAESGATIGSTSLTLAPALGAQLKNEFFAFDADFRGGVRVAAGDVNGDGRDDVVTAAGPTGGPHVRVFDTLSDALPLSRPRFRLMDEFFAYEASFRGGVYVATGDVVGNSQFAEIVTGPGEGGGPHLKVFSRDASGKMQLYAEAFVQSSDYDDGVRVGLADLGSPSGTSPRPLTIYVGLGQLPGGMVFDGDAGLSDYRLWGYGVRPGSLVDASMSLLAAFDSLSDKNGLYVGL